LGKRKRITRKELKHDALLESASKTTRFIEDHLSKVVIAVVAIIVVTFGWNMLMRARRATELEANVFLTSATQALNSGMTGQASDQLQAIISEYPGTRSAAAATCYLGALRFQEGSYEEALALFDDYLARYDRTGTLHNLALEGKAAVLEQQRQFIPAADAYTRLARASRDNPDAFSRHMLNAARCYRSEPDWTRAHNAAQEVLDRYPDSYLAPEARMTISEADARGRT
jgi:outer membrane protein assembly factor BamD (BamD/ComL family)